MRIAVVVGTRPEFIKTWSVIKAIRNRSDMDLLLVHTGQHYDYEMSQAFFEDLSIEAPDYHLGVGSHPTVEQTTSVMNRLAEVLANEMVDILLVQGDTNSCMGAAVAAVQMGIPVGHIEAGCRSYDTTMPEEINRIVIDSVSSLLFAPSAIAHSNLLRQGCEPDTIVLAGNTSVDALEEGLRLLGDGVDTIERPYAVATIHRAGNTDDKNRLEQILLGLGSLPMRCMFPVHPRTKKKIEEFGLGKSVKESQLMMVPPMGYLTFLNVLRHSNLIVTDSGGVQEEAALLSKPTLTVRNSTEWPETAWAGFNLLVPAVGSKIAEAARRLTQAPDAEPKHLYESGAGERIVDAIADRHRRGRLAKELINMIDTGYPILKLSDSVEGKVLMSFDKSGFLSSRQNGKRFLLEVYRELTNQEET